jgi:acyl carrier protein phosphodiesterase
MILHNWLYHYRYPEGIHKSWQGMSNRLEKMNDATFAIEIWKNNFTELQTIYNQLIIALRHQFMMNQKKY